MSSYVPPQSLADLDCRLLTASGDGRFDAARAPLGHLFPLQVTFTFALPGVRTNSRLSFTPRLVRLPKSVTFTPARSLSGRFATSMRRSAVAVAGLPGGASVELEVVVAVR